MRILIVAAWASARAALVALLADADDCEIVGEAGGAAELERLLIEAAPEVVVCESAPGESLRVIEALADEPAGFVLLGEDRDDYRLLLEAALPGWALLRREADRIELLGRGSGGRRGVGRAGSSFCAVAGRGAAAAFRSGRF